MRLTIILGFILLLSFNSIAGLIQTDAFRIGDNKSFKIRSTDNALVWLDFGITSQHSFDYVISNLSKGGLYENWRLPDENEVIDLWDTLFLDLTSYQNVTHSQTPYNRWTYDNSYENYQLYPAAKAAIRIIGADYINGIFKNSTGLYVAGGSIKGVSLQGALSSYSSGYAYAQIGQTYFDYTNNVTSSGMSTLLVKKASVVDEPKSLSLLTLSFLFFLSQFKIKVRSVFRTR
jgi:hypothetical protein